MFDGAPLDLTVINRLDLLLHNGTVIRSDVYPLAIDISGGVTGEVLLRLGDLEDVIPDAGTYIADVKTYDGAVNGFFWGRIRIVMLKDPTL